MLSYLKLKKEIKIKTINWETIEKIQAIWTKIESLKKFELNTLPVYDIRYIKTKIRTYGDKIYTDVRDLNVPEVDVKCECFTIISIDSLLVYKKQILLASIFRQLFLSNWKQANDRLSWWKPFWR